MCLYLLFGHLYNNHISEIVLIMFLSVMKELGDLSVRIFYKDFTIYFWQDIIWSSNHIIILIVERRSEHNLIPNDENYACLDENILLNYDQNV